MKQVFSLFHEQITYAWEQRKLVDILKLLKDGTHGSHKDVTNGHYLLSAKNIKDGRIFWDKTDRIISDEDYKKIHSTFKINKGDVLLTIVGSIGETAIFNVSEEITFQRSVAILRPIDEISSDFLYSEITSPKFQKFLNLNKSTSAQPGIYLGDLANISFSFPENKEEQKMIGRLFTYLNSTITLQQRKCENLKKLKKGLLQKMFPKNGSNFPELRFPGFTDAWEQRKLSEITKRVQGNDGRMNLPTLTISAANGWMNQEDRFSGNIAGKEQKNYTLLHKGELSYNHGNSKLAKYGTVFSLDSYEEALVPRVYHSFKMTNGDAKFIENYFASKIPDRELSKLVSSGARMDGLLNINYDDFMGIKVTIPSLLEQINISTFLTKLDILITLQQRKLESMKQLKKGLLQQMFV
ncbi:restriction endonuclease subunit S [Succinivibrio sp.]|uniref:restriction endonuclease subunit S n=1 Tax=Succinivibrio sp. TaxID=2053619 RepID=UPI00259117D1|nr:restriction endonuclease subunit S [Succinivibrio sp.]MDD6206509.1 restriction endonuclease subunit S [Succinivibrio sp.]